MSLNRLLTATAAAALIAGLASPQIAAAQTTPTTPAAKPAAKAQTQGEAAAATGKLTTDAPAGSKTQGTAWAVQQGMTPAPGAAPTATAAGPKVVPAGDLIETARASGQFTTFLKATDATNLTGVLKNNKNLTVFAPTDAAFAALPPGQLDRLMADKAGMQKLMTHHVINARVDSSKIKGAKGPVTTVANDKMELDGSGQVLKADNATIVQPDVMATNGVLHVVDHVLIPGAAGASTAATAGGAAAPASATTTTTTTTTTGATPPAAAPETSAAKPQPNTQPNTPQTPPKPQGGSSAGPNGGGCDVVAAILAQAGQPMSQPAAPGEPNPNVHTAPLFPLISGDQPRRETAPPRAPVSSAELATPVTGEPASTTAAMSVQTVTNGPVPDTPENRRKYGSPMSHAGKRTPARGN